MVVGWVTLVPRGAELEVMSHALKGAPSRESLQEPAHGNGPRRQAQASSVATPD